MTNRNDLRILVFVLWSFTASCQNSTSTSDTQFRGIGRSLQQQGSLLCGNSLPEAKQAYRFDLSLCRGQYSYLATYTQAGGINDVIDADGERRFTLLGYEHLMQQNDKFAPKVKRRVDNLFKRDSKKSLPDLVEGLSGKRVTPLSMATAVTSILESGDYELTMHVLQAAVRISPYLSIANGGGSYVILDRDAHFINVGYGTGGNLLKDLRKGRSFGVTKERAALDASDVDYLDGLEQVLASGQEEAFYSALFEFLTASNTSAFSFLEPMVQAVAVDFAAVYTAELDRHLMVDLEPNRYAWEQDLLEATWVSAYVARANHLLRDNVMVKGRPRDFFAQGTSGGGIGKTAQDRRKLSAAISRHLWQQTDNLAITRLASLINAEHGDDVLHKLSDLLTAKQSTDYVLENAKAITEAGTAFLMHIMKSAHAIPHAALVE